MTTQQPIDDVLVARAKQGDNRAFDLLVLRHQQKIVSLITRIIHDPHEALDISQEVFLKAYQGLAKFRGDSAFYTWLHRIAINTAKSALITQNRRPPKTDLDIEFAETQSYGEKLHDYADPEHELLSEEIATTIKSALEALPEDLRNTIIMRELEGKSYDEIAKAMSCPIGTVRSRIFRARDAIEKRIRPLLET